jgi:acetyl esterase
MYLHGGGGVIGSLRGYDTICRLIADETTCLVASIDYRLAPEHPHPAGLDDAIAAWRWIREAAPRFGADPARLAIAGDSMGGYLSVMIERRERSAPRPRALGLVYPLLDLTLSQRSIETYAEGFLLTKPMMHWFQSLYCPDPATQRAASPWFGDVAGSPTTVIATAGFDPLGDEGRAWAARLAAAGTRVIHRDHESLVHGFLALTGAVRAARSAVEAFCADLRAAVI